jgi:hypothetical protein
VVEQIALRTEGSDFEIAFDAAAAALADGITGADCSCVSQWSCGRAAFPFIVTANRALPDNVTALLCEVAEKLGLGDAGSEPASCSPLVCPD